MESRPGPAASPASSPCWSSPPSARSPSGACRRPPRAEPDTPDGRVQRRPGLRPCRAHRVAGARRRQPGRRRRPRVPRDDPARPRACTTEVQDAVGMTDALGGFGMARVRNVIAVLPGTAPTGRVFLVAHYDSVQVSYGGNDDGAGVATLLETARILARGRAAAQRHRLRPHRRRGGLPVRGRGVREPAPPGRRRRGGAQPRGPRIGRPGHHVRDVDRQRQPRERLRLGGAVPGRHELRGRGLPDPAQRHRLHAVPRRRGSASAGSTPRTSTAPWSTTRRTTRRPQWTGPACSTTATTRSRWPGPSARPSLGPLIAPAAYDSTYFPVFDAAHPVSRAGWSGRWPGWPSLARGGAGRAGPPARSWRRGPAWRPASGSASCRCSRPRCSRSSCGRSWSPCARGTPR